VSTGSEKYLKTLQVSHALGVSVSTIKRWVDLGMIQAVRTAGKHRLIPYSEALRLAKELGVSEMNVLSMSNAMGDGDLEDQTERVCELLEKLLRESESDRTRTLLRTMHAAGWSGARLADQVILPVLSRLRQSSRAGLLDIYQEREASQILVTSLVELVERVGKTQSEDAPLALGAAIEGDANILSPLIGELVLRELGWRVRNFGMNVPLRSLANASLQSRPRLVFLSINYLADEERFLREYQAFHEVATMIDVAVIVAGHALKPAIRSRMVYASFGERMAHLAEFAKRLSARTVSGSLDDRWAVGS
jgi:MerR family transcriptional regulator, light-induced transcriptional regulator